MTFDLTSDVVTQTRELRNPRATKSTKPAKQTSHVKKDTERNRIRSEIAAQTEVRCDNFLLHNKDLFLPVLPTNNYVSKLIATNQDNPKIEPIPFRQIERQPQDVKATMKPYQLSGLSFLIYMQENGSSAILGDEMGLGKTLQTLALFQYLKDNEPDKSDQYRPHLVLGPLSVLQSWSNEAKKWTPHLTAMIFHGTASQKQQLKSNVQHNRPDIVITNYETFVSEKNWFKSAFAWRYCVLDEGHKIKNERADVSKSLQSIKSEYRLLLTGTPVQNNLQEMWALFHWLHPKVFSINTKDVFTESFDLTKGKVSSTFMDSARNLLELLMLRRTKISPGVDLGLPPKKEVLLYVPLTNPQREWYLRVLTRAGESMIKDIFSTKAAPVKDEKDDKLNLDMVNVANNDMHPTLETASGVGTGAWTKLMNLLMQLRKVCVHPYLIPGSEPDPYYFGDHIRTSSGKFMALDKLLDEHVGKRGEKVLIFSGFTSTLDWTEDLLTLKGCNADKAPYRYTRLDGSTGRARRNLAVRTFNDVNSEDKIMLISTRAGGLGLNLIAASTVIFLDMDWNPQVDIQAEARAHRIGQTKPVTIYKICTQGTVEEQMLERITKKLYLSVKITESMQDLYSDKKRKRVSDSGVPASDMPDIGLSQLQGLIKKGAMTLMEAQAGDMQDWSFDKLLSECQNQTLDKVESTISEDEWLAKAAHVECTVLDGVKYKRHKEESEKIQLLDDRTVRRVGKNTTVLVNGYAVSKESMACGDWEAVPTYAGKDPRLAEVKREKAAIQHQSHCQVCHEEDNLLNCMQCPRAYHSACLEPRFRARITSLSGLSCPQHRCNTCFCTTAEAGGMTYRCRSCEKAYCENCLQWNEIKLVGAHIKEFEELEYGPKDTAWFIDCATCLPAVEERPKKRRRIEA